MPIRPPPARALAAALAACVIPAMTSAAPGPAEPAAWNDWHAKRMVRLAAPDGWTALVGLHWLEPGENRFAAAGLPGTFRLEGGQVRLEASPGDGYTLGGQPVTGRALATDANGAPPDRLDVGTKRVAVIERGGKLALRVWDAAAPARAAFHGIDTFAYDPRWRIEARWEAYPAPRTVEVPSIIGVPTKETAPGRAHFTVDGKAWALEPTLEDGDLFFVFKDATSRTETYGAGRFLQASAPKGGRVILDFNYAYNPPCALTAFATCPLPRSENVLPLRVEAGEKRVAGH